MEGSSFILSFSILEAIIDTLDYTIAIRFMYAIVGIILSQTSVISSPMQWSCFFVCYFSL